MDPFRNKRGKVDGDLTGIPVSNTSMTYPYAAFGHMNDEIRLGYQGPGVVSLESPTYGRLSLSVERQSAHFNTVIKINYKQKWLVFSRFLG